MNVYSLEFTLAATAYIKADSEEQAREIALETLVDGVIELSDRYQPAGDNICIDGRSYGALLDNDEDVALSPVMTITKVRDDDIPELVEEDIDDVE